MTASKNQITKVLKSLLNKRVIQKLSKKGEIPRLSSKGKIVDLRRFTVEFAVYCGHRVEKDLRRDLHKREFNVVANKVESFLKEAYKP
jgi:hypothetical protein